MAIIKSIEGVDGVVCAYHRILSTSVNYEDGVAQVHIAEYLDKESRVGGKAYVRKSMYSLPQDKGVLDLASDTELRKVLYAGVKAFPAYDGSKDDL